MTLALMFVLASQANHLPEGLLRAVCFVESNHSVTAVHHDDGGADSVGVCQIQLPRARLLGYRGSQDALFAPQTNIRYSARYLSRLLDRYDGDPAKAISAYNMGSWKLNSKGKTANQKYVDKVMKAWREHR